MRSTQETVFNEQNPREYRAWALPAFLLLSLLVHGFGFYAFHVVYPAPQDTPLPSATLGLVVLPDPEAATPPAPGDKLLADWLQSMDPALLTNWQGYTPNWAFLERGIYAPLYEQWRPSPAIPEGGTPFTRRAEQEFAGLAQQHWDWQLGKNPPPMELSWLGAQGTAPAGPARTSAPRTQVHISTMQTGDSTATAETDTPVPVDLPPFQAHAEGTAGIQNAEFLVGIAPGGQVLFTLTRRTSNSDELDAAAEQYLRTLTLQNLATAAGSGNLPPAAATVQWLRARFHWGKEVFRP